MLRQALYPKPTHLHNNMKRLALLSFITFLLAGTLLAVVPQPAQAQVAIFERGSLGECVRGRDRDGDGKFTSEGEFGPGGCSVQQILELSSNLVEWGAGISGALALLMYVIGGVWMLFSGGNSGRVERGKDIVIGTTIALIFILGSWIIVDFTLRALKGTPDTQQLQIASCGDRVCELGEYCKDPNDNNGGKCTSICERDHPSNQPGAVIWSCVNLPLSSVPDRDACEQNSLCELNKCPGGNATVCSALSP